MIKEIFVADNPKIAYEQAITKYGHGVELISARQIVYEDGQLRSEVEVSIDKELFMKQSGLENKDKELQSELSRLKSELDTMKRDASSVREDTIIEAKVKKLFISKGITESWISKKLLNIVNKNILLDEKLLISHFIEEIDSSLCVKKEDMNVPKIMMFVGPTGVGKTTTIAKLAARYAYLKDKAYKVALLNLDSYKVGAQEQLSYYADLMQIRYESMDGTEEFGKVIKELSGYDVVLVDTAGMSPYDTQKLIKTIGFMKADIHKNIEVNLVVSATVKYEDMFDIYNNFSFLNLNSIVFSKFDETKYFGTLLNFMLEYKVPMSYFSIGQEVPDDIVVASKEYLLEQFIGDLDDR